MCTQIGALKAYKPEMEGQNKAFKALFPLLFNPPDDAKASAPNSEKEFNISWLPNTEIFGIIVGRFRCDVIINQMLWNNGWRAANRSIPFIYCMMFILADVSSTWREDIIPVVTASNAKRDPLKIKKEWQTMIHAQRVRTSLQVWLRSKRQSNTVRASGGSSGKKKSQKNAPPTGADEGKLHKEDKSKN